MTTEASFTLERKGKNMKTTDRSAKYQIRYQHTSWQSADSMAAARRAVKAEARVSRLYTADVPDGLYCYLSQADKDRDDTGARAYAVICGPDQQAD